MFAIFGIIAGPYIVSQREYTYLDSNVIFGIMGFLGAFSLILISDENKELSDEIKEISMKKNFQKSSKNTSPKK